MKVSNLKVEPREARGSKQVARLREAGQVPGIVYGGDKEPVSITMAGDDVERGLRKHHRVFRLELNGATEPVYMQDVQLDVLNDRPVHVDFRRIDIEAPLQVVTELAYIGHPKGESHGGVLVRDMTKIRLKALPLSVPYEIPVPVADLDVGDRIVASDLKLPDGVTLDCPPDMLVCHI